jgi:hypothetical protein
MSRQQEQHPGAPPADEQPLEHHAFDDIFSQVMLGKFIPEQASAGLAGLPPQWPDVPIPQSTHCIASTLHRMIFLSRHAG